MPSSILASHSGVLPFSVAMVTEKPASFKAMNGSVVSWRHGKYWVCERCRHSGSQTCGIVAIIGH
jgi:hypothetical protein